LVAQGLAVVPVPDSGTEFRLTGEDRHSTANSKKCRILNSETGCRVSHGDARFLGAFQHFYSTNRFGDPAYGTHYVVLAYELQLDYRPEIVADAGAAVKRDSLTGSPSLRSMVRLS
jgi:hypothetical protein